jgi:YidC/Oxa1 family membrane protein insertase
MAELFNTILYQPIFNLLVFLYNIVPGNDIGIAIILMTIIIKVILYPLTAKSLKSQRDLQKIQPQITELQKKYKDQKEKLSQELMALYKREKVNPFSSCFPMLIQLPFLIAVFMVFRNGLTNPEALDALYSFIHNPGKLDPTGFGFLNLANPNIVLAVLAGAAQFWQTKMLVQKKPPKGIPGSKDESMTAAMNKQMTYFMPLLTVFIGTRLPGGLMLYWLTTTFLTVGQQYWLFRKKPGQKEPTNPSQINHE